MSMIDEEIRRVDQVLGSRVICARCKATLETYATNCRSELSERCEGFETIERAAAE